MFDIKKSFKLLGLVLSVSTLLSFSNLPVFAIENSNAVGITGKAIIHELTTLDPGQEEWEQIRHPRHETQIVVTPPHIVVARELINRVEHELELKIEDTKHSLENYFFSDDDRIYLSLILQSTYETAKHFTLNIKPLNISNDSKLLMYVQYFKKTIDEKVNAYISQHPDFSIPSRDKTDICNLCSCTLLYIFKTAHDWSQQQFLFSGYFANHILSKYLQGFVNDVCRSYAFIIS